jgi:predicted metal-dependent hydrolase
LYRVIIKVARTKLRSIQIVPDMPLPDAEGNEIPEEEKQLIQKKIDEVLKVNVETEKINEEINKFQSKVKIAYRPITDITKGTECALMRVSNYREPKTTEEF